MEQNIDVAQPLQPLQTLQTTQSNSKKDECIELKNIKYKTML